MTGQVARIDLRTETATIVNAGHPLPLRLRRGRVESVALEADAPFGIVRDLAYRVQRLPLEPGDRLMFLTDGMHGAQRRRHRSPRRWPRRGDASAGGGAALVHAVLAATGGTPEDDATIMCLDWHGGPPRDRLTDSGANE